MLRFLGLALFLLPNISAQTGEHFEVASIRISQRTGPASWSEPGEASFTATNIPLRILIQMAFEVEEAQLANDNRCGEERYDIAAQPASGALTPERLKPMLSALLAERFDFRYHRETRTVSGYALVTAKDGPKFQLAHGSRPGQSAILRGRLIARGADLSIFASMLARPLGAPVVNRTNLPGIYDLELRFAPNDNPDSGQPSIFTAVQEQLGLKLDAQRVPVNILVVDQCQSVPTEN